MYEYVIASCLVSPCAFQLASLLHTGLHFNGTGEMTGEFTYPTHINCLGDPSGRTCFLDFCRLQGGLKTAASRVCNWELVAAARVVSW